jgi:hypothetical protein
MSKGRIRPFGTTVTFDSAPESLSLLYLYGYL